MIPAIWRLLWRGTGLRYIWKFLFGSWLVDRIWGDEKHQRRREQEESNAN